jgi:SAM-dependent methyltransferase
MTRNEKILARISKSMKVLEVGPSYSPVLMRSDGWNAFSLDHSTADELRRKYEGHANVDVSKIQDVDFVWRDGPLESAIPTNQLGTFDACIGSHMIEHVPSLVAFFESMERILSPDGVISLAVPDKRFCFDFFQPITMTGEVVAAHRDRRTRHNPIAEFNAIAYMVRSGTEVAWGQQPTQVLEFYNGDLKAAAQFLARGDDDGSYRDVHGWYFTQSSFRLIMLELAWLGLLNFHEVYVSPTTHCEFFVTLARGAPRLSEKQFQSARMDLATNILLEIREQTDFLIEGSHYIGPPRDLLHT